MEESNASVGGSSWLVALCGLVAISSAACSDPPPGRLVIASGAANVAACGRPGDASVSIQNAGGRDVRWTAAIEGIDGAVVQPERGVLRASSTVGVEVHVPPQLPGAVVHAALLFRANEIDVAPLRVPIEIVREGAILAPDRSVLDFGVIPVGAASPRQMFTAKNTGNRGAALSPAMLDGFSLSWEKPTVRPGDSAPASVVFAPSRVGTFASGAPLAGDPGCGDHARIEVRGIGSDGVVGISPGVVDFGLVPCGKTAAPVKISVLNVSKQPFDIEAQIHDGPLFQVSPPKATVPGESSVTVEVSMPSVPQTAPLAKDFFTGKLTITTNAPKDAAHTLPIVASPAGGILTLTSSPQVDFKKRNALASKAALEVSLQNFGNVPVTLAANVAAPFSNPAPITLSPGAAADLPIEHDALFVDLGKDLAEPITLTTSDPYCAPLPGGLVAKAHVYEDVVAAAPRFMDHACAVGKSGNAYCWGRNSYGQLGDGTTTHRALPTLVSNLSNVKAIAVGGVATCAMTTLGTVWCWGDGKFGQLGDGQQWSQSWVPKQVMGVVDAIAIAMNGASACVLRSTGGVACWGIQGYIGDGSAKTGNNFVSAPVNVANLSNVESISSGAQMTCAVRKGFADLVCWGEDLYGEFGMGGGNFWQASSPVAIPNTYSVSAVAVSFASVCLLKKVQSGVHCWGYDRFGTLHKTVHDEGQTTAINTSLTVSPRNRCGIDAYSQSNVRCYGNGSGGVLGTGLGLPDNTWVRKASFVSMGAAHVVAIDGDTLWQWGILDLAQPEKISAPVPVPGFDP